VTIAYLKVRNSLRKTFGDSDVLKNVDTLKIALKAGEYAAIGLAGAVVTIAAVMAIGLVPILAMGAAFMALITLPAKLGKAIREEFLSIDWKGSGTAIVDGLIDGLKAGAGALNGAILGLGEGVKKTFKDALGIHSPSKVFEEYGENTTAGYERGVKGGASGAQDAVNSMVSAPSGGGARGGAPVTVNITINAGGGNAKEVAAAVSSQTIIEQITKAIVDAMHGGGVGVPG
jgi:hypothetical protein